MSEESKKFGSNEVLDELLDQSGYAIHLLGASRQALLDSKIAKDFNGKPPRPVIMHAVSRALTECEMPNLDHKKFLRGLISLCVFFLEDEDVNLALKIKEDLLKSDKE